MKRINKKTYKRKFNLEPSFRKNSIINQIIFFVLTLGLTACSEFVEIDPPKNILISETVFNDASTVESAFANIFYDMREQGITSGYSGLSILLGIYSDELNYYRNNVDLSQFYFNTVTPTNAYVSSWWSNAYNIIYNANDIIKGVKNSDALNSVDKDHYIGQALFVRAYMNSLLVNIYGDIPYISTTDYITNNTVSRQPIDKVYENIINDLVLAIDLLEDTGNPSGEKVLPGLSTAKALLARIYLYNENWELAEINATQVISDYSLEPNLNDVFLKESSETIWQFKPSLTFKNTQEAVRLIIQAIPGQNYALTDSFFSAFEVGDLRKDFWTNSISNTNNTVTLNFPYKYKAGLSETESIEYSIIFRLAEQYLIRAEARAKQGDISGAKQDLNIIRNRAGLNNTTANSINELLDAILQERRIELFAEQGHRWFDLKRTNKANSVLSAIKTNWEETNILLPIPETEIAVNPNLLPQNLGY